MNQDKLILTSGCEERVIEFGNEAVLKTPITLQDWYMVYAGYVMADNGDVVDDVTLHFHGQKFFLNEDGNWEEL